MGRLSPLRREPMAVGCRSVLDPPSRTDAVAVHVSLGSKGHLHPMLDYPAELNFLRHQGLPVSEVWDGCCCCIYITCLGLQFA